MSELITLEDILKSLKTLSERDVKCWSLPILNAYMIQLQQPNEEAQKSMEELGIKIFSQDTSSDFDDEQ